MITKISAILIFIISGLQYAAAQNAANNWFFGNHTGLTFNQAVPVSIENSSLTAFEGASAISDAAGRTLMYTNGISVFNRRNLQMKNGGGLAGNLSSTCNSVILPMPGNDSLFYIFTVSAASLAYQPFNYSIVNIRGDNGLGEVVDKNLFLDDPIFEKLAAVRHCNKRDVWIIVKQWNNDKYESYLLTDAGLNINPVISSPGLSVSGVQNNAIGALKFSPDGRKLAAVHGGAINQVQLMDFNSSTGILSNQLLFSPNTSPPDVGYLGIYGAEFSPDGKLLYVSSKNNPAQTVIIYQFDITVPTISAITASRQVIMERSDWQVGALQAGPDKKIYVSLTNDSALSVIESPDVKGLGCNFVYNKIPLNKFRKDNEILTPGLPIFVSSDLQDRYAAYSFNILRGADCSDLNLGFKINYTADVDSVRWDFGDGIKSNFLTPRHSFPRFGTYQVKLRIFRTDCSGSHTIDLSQPVIINGRLPILPKDISFCNKTKTVVRAAVKADNYLWNTGSIADSIEIINPGIYWIEIETNGCVTRDSFELRIKQPSRIRLGNDTSLCFEKPVVLKAPITGSNILWNTGDTTRSIQVGRAGLFYLQLENDSSCLTSDTIHVRYGNCKVYFPSAFTPNGDGINESFGLINGTFALDYDLVIYDRWGRMVFHTVDQARRWDGSSLGKKLPEGNYSWFMKFKTSTGFKQQERGNVLLIR